MVIYKQAILVNMSLKMTKGKIAAQVAHASLTAALQSLNKKYFKEWQRNGQSKIVLKCPDTETMIKLHRQAKSRKIITSMITDAGKTQVPPGSKTALAIGPETEENLGKLVSEFKLL
jgi:PTH2 family peptidyl-tRNA hydrolase